MVEATDTVEAPNPFADVEAAFLDEKVFARTERMTINKLVELRVEAASEEWMQRRQMPFNDADFQAAYQHGYPVLLMGLKGVDVEYQYSDDLIRRIYVPLYEDKNPDKYGVEKQRNSQSYRVSAAFLKLYDLRPFGPVNSAKLIGKIAIWGQHLGEAEIDGEEREWSWDVPRTSLPDDYQFDGEPRILQARSGAPALGVTAGVASLTEEESTVLVIKTLIGRDGGDKEGANLAVLNLDGLTGAWFDIAAQGGDGVLGHAETLGLVKPKGGKVVAA